METPTAALRFSVVYAANLFSAQFSWRFNVRHGAPLASLAERPRDQVKPRPVQRGRVLQVRVRVRGRVRVRVRIRVRVRARDLLGLGLVLVLGLGLGLVLGLEVCDVLELRLHLGGGGLGGGGLGGGEGGDGGRGRGGRAGHVAGGVCQQWERNAETLSSRRKTDRPCDPWSVWVQKPTTVEICAVRHGVLYSGAVRWPLALVVAAVCLGVE